MPHDLSSAKVVVLVVVMKGCPACHEFAPRFRKLAARYERCLPVVILDADEHPEIADRYKVQATPTTLVLRRPYGQARFEGSRSNEEIEGILQLATRNLTCEI